MGWRAGHLASIMDHEARVVFSSEQRRLCHEHELVLQSAAISYRSARRGGEYVLVVAVADEARALEEFGAYARENRGWQPRDPLPVLTAHGGGWTGITFYVIVLCTVSMLRDRWVFDVDWAAAGRLSAGAVCAGQWYRTVTALTLHVDLQHLAANLTFGGIFGLFAGRMLGPGLAWATILATGALGNGVNAWIQPPDHNAIGASTAVFGCLGLLSAYSFTVRQTAGISWRRVWVPIVGGVILLGFLGTGGERTDFMAHVTGFGSGLLLGVLFGHAGQRIIPGWRGQAILGFMALSAIGLSWYMALAQPGAS